MPLARDVIWSNSTNLIQPTDLVSYTDKIWARGYHPLTRYNVRTNVDENDVWHANFDDLLPLYADEESRLNEPADYPNVRAWRLETEADIELWWHTEVSNPVLAAWNRYPRIMQTSHTKPLSDINIAENVDSTYALYIGNRRAPVIIGEMKRNLINPMAWLRGELTGSQEKLARELRGYADKYECPQIFCWDGETLLLLQFRAHDVRYIREEVCEVDCWVIPREKGSCSLRYALHRFMVQGLRRCQSIRARTLTVGGLTECGREFYTGRPVWQRDGKFYINHPLGYYRIADIYTGALGWRHDNDPDGVTWETEPFW